MIRGAPRPANQRPPWTVIDGRAVLDQQDTGGPLAYVLGDTIFEVSAEMEVAQEVLAHLPPPGIDTRAFGPAVEPAPADCPGLDDAEMSAQLPRTLDGVELDPWPMPSSMAAGLGAGIADVVASAAEISGQLLYVAIGGIAGAVRFDGSDRVRTLDIEGRHILVAEDSGDACYAHDDLLFFSSGGDWAAFMSPVLAHRAGGFRRPCSDGPGDW